MRFRWITSRGNMEKCNQARQSVFVELKASNSENGMDDNFCFVEIGI